MKPLERKSLHFYDGFQSYQLPVQPSCPGDQWASTGWQESLKAIVEFQILINFQVGFTILQAWIFEDLIFYHSKLNLHIVIEYPIKDWHK